MHILDEYLYDRRGGFGIISGIEEYYLLLLVNQRIKVSSDTEQQPNSPKFRYNRPVV